MRNNSAGPLFRLGLPAVKRALSISARLHIVLYGKSLIQLNTCETSTWLCSFLPPESELTSAQPWAQLKKSDYTGTFTVMEIG